MPILKQGGGNLVGVIMSALECVPKADIMSAAPKAVIEMLVRGVAKESGKHGIRANCVAPGWFDAGLGKCSQQAAFVTGQTLAVDGGAQI